MALQGGLLERTDRKVLLVMLFLRKRREKRDQEAGLVFRWRGARRHHAGKLVALILVSAFFAFFAYAVKIDAVSYTHLTLPTTPYV